MSIVSNKRKRYSKAENAIVVKRGVFDMQVCVPKEWSDDQIREFAESHNPCGTAASWSIRHQGSEYLNGDEERTQCQEHTDNCHIMLNA